LNRKEKRYLVDFLEALISGIENQIDTRTALELSLASVPKGFRKRVEAVLKAYRAGRTLYDSFILAGFPKEYFFPLKAFEQEGNVGEGLKAVKELVETDVKLDNNFFKIDLEVLFLFVVIIVGALFITGYYLPTLGKLFSDVVDDPRNLSGIAAKLVNFKDLTVGKVLRNPLYISFVVITLTVWKTRAYRLFLKVFPQYRRLTKLVDKSSIALAFSLSRNYAQTIFTLAESFGEKYSFKEIAKRFRLGAGFEAFEISDLFDNEEEKRLFILAGNNDFPAIFRYLKKRYETERDKAFQSLATILQIAIFMTVLGLIIGVVVFAVAPMSQLIQAVGG